MSDIIAFLWKKHEDFEDYLGSIADKYPDNPEVETAVFALGGRVLDVIVGLITDLMEWNDAAA